MYDIKCLAFVIAGGKGERLFPLTKDRTKPSVPFGGKYRIVDFVLSNLINSGVYSIYVLVQYKSQSLIEHIRTGRRRAGLTRDHFITVVPPQMRTSDSCWYKGTADSIYQNINLILDSKPDIVCVFAADHIYRMDIRQMINLHITRKADVTVATLPVSISQAHQFGIAKVDKDSCIMAFVEKPKDPKLLLPSDKKTVYSSMGNYIFNAEVLVDILLKDACKRESEHDFGRSVIPRIIKTHKVLAYSFQKNLVPAIKPYEEVGYWRDVGNLNSYWKANMDLLGERPLLDLDNDRWPIITSGFDGPPARIINGEIVDSIVGEGSFVNRATIHRSVIGRGVVVENGSYIENSIIMGFNKIGRNVKIKRAIIDRFNSIADNITIGYDLKKDKARYFVDKDSGIVVIPRGQRSLL